MTLVPTRWMVLTVAVCIGIGLWITLESGAFRREVWTRPAPLRNPTIGVTVIDEQLCLPNELKVRPVGVRRANGVSKAEYETALRAAVKNGVVIEQTFTDGFAELRVEPQFYNWCGTRSSNLVYWAGGYVQCSLSDLLVLTGYAVIDENAGWLGSMKLEQLQFIERYHGREVCPIRERQGQLAFRCGIGEQDIRLE